MEPRDVQCGKNLQSLPAGNAGADPGYYAGAAGGIDRIDGYIKNPTAPDVMTGETHVQDVEPETVRLHDNPDEKHRLHRTIFKVLVFLDGIKVPERKFSDNEYTGTVPNQDKRY